MTQYLVSDAWDVALESLEPIDPQPATIGFEYTRRQYAASGVVIDELGFVRLNFSALEDIDQYQSLLAQFGLDTATTANVSVYVQDERYNWILRNAICVLPQIGTDGQRSDFFLRGFSILLKQLRAQS